MVGELSGGGGGAVVPGGVVGGPVVGPLVGVGVGVPRRVGVGVGVVPGAVGLAVGDGLAESDGDGDSDGSPLGVPLGDGGGVMTPGVESPQVNVPPTTGWAAPLYATDPAATVRLRRSWPDRRRSPPGGSAA
jgi:hypothetical protein